MSQFNFVMSKQRAKARLIFARNTNRKDDAWLAILCTDAKISSEEAVCIYEKCWDIEVFFKMCKSYLALGKESQSRFCDEIKDVEYAKAVKLLIDTMIDILRKTPVLTEEQAQMLIDQFIGALPLFLKERLQLVA